MLLRVQMRDQVHDDVLSASVIQKPHVLFLHARDQVIGHIHRPLPRSSFVFAQRGELRRHITDTACCIQEDLRIGKV